MRFFYLFFYLIFLFSCSSVKKNPYDSRAQGENNPFQKEKPLARDIAYLQNSSPFGEGSFHFITKQMKEVIKNYKKMRQQLIAVEDKLDRLLAPKNLTPPAQNEGKPRLSHKKAPLIDQKVWLAHTEAKIKNLIQKISHQDFNLKKEDREKLLTQLKSLLRAKHRANDSLAQEDDKRDSADSLLLEEEAEGDIFEEDSGNKFLKNHSHSLEKTAQKTKEPIIIPDKERGDLRLSLKTIRDHQILAQDILSGKYNLDDKNKTALLQSLRDKIRVLRDSPKTLSPFLISAKKLFKKRSYESAISKFQKYRDTNPEGSYYPEATFYIGQSFKKLKMPVEADVFFKELVHSYPESLWAYRAKKLLKE